MDPPPVGFWVVYEKNVTCGEKVVAPKSLSTVYYYFHKLVFIKNTPHIWGVPI